MKKFMKSLGCAFSGVRYALTTERNMRVHLSVFMLVLIAGYILEISKFEFLLIFAVSALTFSLELTNTAIERLADRISPEYDEEIGVVKDVMAGAVLVSSIFSIVIGVVIFLQPLLLFIQR